MPLYSHRFIREQAEKLLHQVGFDEPPIDVRKIAGKLGIEIVELSLPTWFFGALMQVENDHYIVLNKIMPEPTKVFTISHELAHHQMHPGEICYMKNRLRPYFHREADIFAAELCMPSNLVRREARKWFNDFKFLAKLFNVTETAMIRKLEELELIPKGHYAWQNTT